MKIAIVGGGGIGSYLVRNCHELFERDQLPDVDIMVFDSDGVEESNILYQDFSVDDIFSNKAEALAERYFVMAMPQNINDPEELKDYDLVMCCVDNSATRRMIFNAGFNRGGPDFVDLRSEGKSIAVFTKVGNSLDTLLDTLPKKDVSSASCQLAVDKKNKTIQQGNKIVALIGSQVILDRVRGESSSKTLRLTL